MGIELLISPDRLAVHRMYNIVYNASNATECKLQSATVHEMKFRALSSVPDSAFSSKHFSHEGYRHTEILTAHDLSTVKSVIFKFLVQYSGSRHFDRFAVDKRVFLAKYYRYAKFIARARYIRLSLGNAAIQITAGTAEEIVPDDPASSRV